MDGRYFPIVNISQTIEQICKYGSLNDLQISQTVVDTLVTSIRFKKKSLMNHWWCSICFIYLTSTCRNLSVTADHKWQRIMGDTFNGSIICVEIIKRHLQLSGFSVYQKIPDRHHCSADFPVSSLLFFLHCSRGFCPEDRQERRCGRRPSPL